MQCDISFFILLTDELLPSCIYSVKNASVYEFFTNDNLIDNLIGPKVPELPMRREEGQPGMRGPDGADGDMDDGVNEEKGSGNEDSPVEHVRKNFVETWIWTDKMTG